MAWMKEPCPQCRMEADVAVGQFSHGDGRLVWNRGWRCRICTFTMEEDDEGFPPERIRQAILDQEGTWSLTLPDPQERLSTSLKALRRMLNLSLAQTMELRKRIPGRLFSGTRVEMTRLMRLLGSEGVESDLFCEVEGRRL